MTIEEKKEKLDRYKELIVKSKTLEIEILEFEERALENATHITPGVFDKIRASGGKSDLTRAGAFTERDARLEYLVAQKKKTDAEILEILKAINGIKNLGWQNAVYCYYVLDMSYAEIGFQEYISEETARWRRNKGLEVIEF